MITKKLVLICLLAVISGALTAKNQQCLLIDATAREAEVYRPLTEILTAAGYHVAYKGFDAAMDGSFKSLGLKKQDCVFFLLGSEFFCGLPHSHVSRKILGLIETFSKLRGKTIGIFLPSLRASRGMNVVSCFAPAFNVLGLQTPMGQITDPFFKAVNTFLTMPLEMRPLAYQTTLNPAHMIITGNGSYEVSFGIGVGNDAPRFLPMVSDCQPEIRATLPYGVYWYNLKRKNHLLVSTLTLASFSGITESFHVCPLDFTLRYQMHEMLLQTMCELRHFATGGSSEQKVSRPALPEYVHTFGDPLHAKPGPFSKIAWMELNIFEDRDYAQTKMSKNAIAQDKADRRQRQQRLVRYIVEAGLDTLWISMSPNMYYSSIARYKKQNKAETQRKEEAFLDGIKRFTTMLKKEVEGRKAILPGIYVGFEVANNLYAPHLPQLCAVDLYGNDYPDLPAPLDRGFWTNEVMQPLATFLKKWNKLGLGNGIQIEGVVLDLEMYCRKKTGTFLSTMGFDGYTFKRFKRKKDPVPPVHDRGLYLMNHHKTRDYCRFLELQAEALGSELYTFFSQKIPDCRIMCYTPNILISWFYKGFFRGLSRKSSPLYLMTFNTEFKAHQRWFKKNGIKTQHASILLLSKLAAKSDVEQVRQIRERHHGVWLNRFSRTAEPKAKDWTAIEQPALPERLYSEVFADLNAIG